MRFASRFRGSTLRASSAAAMASFAPILSRVQRGELSARLGALGLELDGLLERIDRVRNLPSPSR